MTGEKSQNELLPLLYGFFRGAGVFNSSITEYEKKFSGKSNTEAIKETIKEFQEKYDISIDGLIDNHVPEKYRPIARAAKSLPWPFLVDMFSAKLKEYGKDGSGGYKTSGEVLRDFITENVRDKVFQR